MGEEQRVRNICLIRDDRAFWETIESFLGAVNAELTRMSGEPETEEILAGKCDDMPEQAFYMCGGLDEAREKAEKLAKKAA